MASKIRDGFDMTSLRAKSHGYTVHRDYAAHFFRWGWASNYVKRGMKVLEVGCGVDTPLVRVLTYQLNYVPSLYVGVDLNKIPKKTGIKWTTILDEFNFNRRHQELVKHDTVDGDGLFDVVVSFEVIEHMPKTEGRKHLRAIAKHLKPDGTFLLSTPVYDGKHLPTAHVHEYTIPELQAEIEKAGFQVVKRFGTYANLNDIKKVCTKEELKLFQELTEFYGNNVMSCFLTPKYPDASRNNAWVLKLK